eukprot:snap_masked-scaffold_29-processed-gene-4.21-mRNA-1 protein AED:1.00 eAED:1.00 QI:0/-1/0/0/-1/1/1/0/78
MSKNGDRYSLSKSMYPNSMKYPRMKSMRSLAPKVTNPWITPSEESRGICRRESLTADSVKIEKMFPTTMFIARMKYHM